MKIPNSLKKFYNFLQEDSWQSTLVYIVLIIIVIRFIIFPGLSFITASELPLVVVESCSMYHGKNFDDWWTENKEWYLEEEITKEEFESFPMRNGLNKGDIILLWNRSPPEVGEIITFKPNPEASSPNPIIHRTISKNPLATKGDNNANQLSIDNNFLKLDETSIPEEDIIGRAVLRVPIVGWIKLIFFEPLRQPHDRGLC